jgi:hypothetical protein
MAAALVYIIIAGLAGWGYYLHLRVTRLELQVAALTEGEN